MDDQEFKTLINEALDNGWVSEEELAYLVSTSISNISRWKEGRNFPHVSMRVGVACLIKAAREKLADKKFNDLINDTLNSGIVSEEDFCHGVNISRTTLDRWKNGVSFPHPEVRSIVSEFVEKKRGEKK